MKKAVISTGSKQYLVTEGETIEVELLNADNKKVKFEPLLVIDDENISVGTPIVKGISVAAEVIEQDKKDDKVSGVRFKAKKRVHKVHGHRQHKTIVKISTIA